MFRVIGGAVVYGLALYGVVKLVDRQKVKAVIRPGAKQAEKYRSEVTADVGQVGGQSADRSGEAVSSAASTPVDTSH